MASPPSIGGSTNVVSDRFSSLAMRCIRAAGMSAAARNTATGFPSNGVSVKTSATT
jgi:hypothetical protein